jgi:hypothetical protein
MGGPTNQLEKMIGMLKEVFYHSETGVCYAGTFLCTMVGEVPCEEYAQFSKHVSTRHPGLAPFTRAKQTDPARVQTKDAIVRHTYPSLAEYVSAEKREVDRLRNYYISGRAVVQYLQLLYRGYNKPLADALAALRVMETAPAVSVSVKRSASPTRAMVQKRARIVRSAGQAKERKEMAEEGSEEEDQLFNWT